MDSLPDKYTTEDAIQIIIRLEKENKELKQQLEALRAKLPKNPTPEEQEAEREREFVKMAKMDFEEVQGELENYAEKCHSRARFSVELDEEQDLSEGISGELVIYNLEGDPFITKKLGGTLKEAKAKIHEAFEEYKEEEYEYMRRNTFGD